VNASGTVDQAILPLTMMQSPRSKARRMKNTLRMIALPMMFALSACATVAQRVPYDATSIATAPLLAGGSIRFWASGDDATYRQWTEAMLAHRVANGLPAPATLLAVSGGSDKGAFGAGLLNAWTRRGGRPDFDIVTGVSTGALIAPFAFLGSTEDATLRALYTTIESRDIYRPRVLGGLLGGSSLLNSAPLAQLISRYVTPAFLDRIAARHRQGRRLLVMTTHLDAQRGVIWDMGAIAASSSPRRLTLFREVLLASSSIPGAFPPVLIDLERQGENLSEMHVDGGTISGFFALPQRILESTPAPPPGSAIYVLYNGQLEPKFEVTSPRTLSILGRALETLLGEADRANVANLREFTRERNIGFFVCSIRPASMEEGARMFDTGRMRKLYTLGQHEGSSATGCLTKTGGGALPASAAAK
jgi:hypothetical protein